MQTNDFLFKINFLFKHDKKKMSKFVEFCPPKTDVYKYNNEEKVVFCPTIGSILKRFCLNNNNIEYYVVINAFIKKQGCNKGLVDRIILEPLDHFVGNNVYYKKSDYPLILSLTNHGSWWVKAMLKEYEFCFLDSLMSFKEIKTSLPISIPSPSFRGRGSTSTIYSPDKPSDRNNPGSKSL